MAAPPFAKHLPPSAGQPRVLALDAGSAGHLPPEVEVVVRAPEARLPRGPFDAIVGTNAGAPLAELQTLLRPGGRLILAAPAGAPERLLTALTEAGYIHCLVETADGLSLYRGERPPAGSPVERTAVAANAPEPRSGEAGPKFLFLLVNQSPNKPAWKLAPGERLEWRAATLVGREGEPQLLAFTSLVKAVAFMQPAILAGRIAGVNKIGKFTAMAAQAWGMPVLLNPEFEAWRAAPPGPALRVDPQVAITGDE